MPCGIDEHRRSMAPATVARADLGPLKVDQTKRYPQYLSVELASHGAFPTPRLIVIFIICGGPEGLPRVNGGVGVMTSVDLAS
jgi:hypothetical protein